MSLLNNKEEEVHGALGAHLWVYIERKRLKHYPREKEVGCNIRVCPECWKVEVLKSTGWGMPYENVPDWENHLVNLALRFTHKKRRVRP